MEGHPSRSRRPGSGGDRAASPAADPPEFPFGSSGNFEHRPAGSPAQSDGSHNGFDSATQKSTSSSLLEALLSTISGLVGDGLAIVEVHGAGGPGRTSLAPSSDPSRWNLIHPKDRARVLRAARRFVRSPLSRATFELRVQRPDGSWRDVEAEAIPQRVKGEVRTIVVTRRDVTQRKRREESLLKRVEELRHAERDRRRLNLEVVRRQEDERQRLAREVHDSLGQMLTSLTLLLKDIEEDLTQEWKRLMSGYGHLTGEIVEVVGQVDPSTPGLGRSLAAMRSQVAQAREQAEAMLGFKRRMRRVRGLTSEAIATTRSIAWQLRPVDLDTLGLIPAIERLATTARTQHAVSIDVHVSGLAKRLPSAMETAIFRITQEALTNVVKHAEARSVTIELGWSDYRFRLVVQDDGRGFDRQRADTQATAEPGMGLAGMRERACLLHARLTIASAPGKGTTIRLEAPLQRSAGLGRHPSRDSSRSGLAGPPP